MSSLLSSMMKERQKSCQELCGNCYTQTDYIYVNDLGIPYTPNFVTQHFKIVLRKNSLTSPTTGTIENTRFPGFGRPGILCCLCRFSPVVLSCAAVLRGWAGCQARQRRILNPLRLPIPSHRHVAARAFPFRSPDSPPSQATGEN